MSKGVSRRQWYLVVCMIVFPVLMFLMPDRTGGRGTYDLPPLPPPEEYGDVFINRFSDPKKVMPVVFSHWVHRPKYTCRVCHM